MVVLSLKYLLDKLRIENRKKYIWGIGAYGNLLGQLLDKEEIVWDGYYDNFEADGKKCKHGKKIYSGEDIKLQEKALYILSMRNYRIVMNQLLENGVEESHIIVFDDITIFNDIEQAVLGDVYDSTQMQFFENKFEGEKCFIIGNGPSLTSNDLEMIHNKEMYSFGANYIFNMYDKTAWRPDFYCVTDPVGIEDIFAQEDRLNYISQNCRYIFSRTNGKLCNDRDKVNNIRLFKYIYSPSEENYMFSDDCSKQVYIGYTITFVMMQLAVYMGFKEIFLLGIDHNQSVESVGDKILYKDINNYSKEMELNNQSGFYPIDKTTSAYMAAKKFADEHRVKIYNATRGGKLEVFERIDLDEILK